MGETEYPGMVYMSRILSVRDVNTEQCFDFFSFIDYSLYD